MRVISLIRTIGITYTVHSAWYDIGWGEWTLVVTNEKITWNKNNRNNNTLQPSTDSSREGIDIFTLSYLHGIFLTSFLVHNFFTTDWTLPSCESMIPSRPCWRNVLTLLASANRTGSWRDTQAICERGRSAMARGRKEFPPQSQTSANAMTSLQRKSQRL